MSAKKQLEHKSTLHYLVLLMFILIVTVSTIALLLDVKHKQSFVLLCLNIAGGTAAILGIIVVMRSKLLGDTWKIISVSYHRSYIVVSCRPSCLLLFYCSRRGANWYLNYRCFIFYWIWISLFTFIFYYKIYTKKNKSYTCHYYINTYYIICNLYFNKFYCHWIWSV